MHTIDDSIYKTGKKALNNNNKNPPIWNGQPQGKKKKTHGRTGKSKT